jgi:N-acetylglucosaminyl-diphospho-decaprenol L-rhamnosyltransferase
VAVEQVLDVEISLVNTSNRDLLERCLASLPAACERLAWHVTVVDNASTDGSAELVEERFPEARLRRNEIRLGFSTNHNLVLRPAVAEGFARYLLILNEDTELRPGAVTELVRFCDGRPEIGAAGPTLVLPDGRKQQSLPPLPLTDFRDELIRMFRPTRPFPQATRVRLQGSCVLVRAEALRRIGLLDERFFIFFEDTDLCRRLWDAGWSCAVCEDAVVLHHEHQTVSKRPYGTAMERQMLRSRYLYFRKHHGRGRTLILVSAARLALALRAAKALVEAVGGRDPSGGQRARMLLDLASYDPRVALLHEIEAVARRDSA